MAASGLLCRWTIRVLAWITTSAPSHQAQPYLPTTWVRSVEALRWHVRLAGPRNFILWRNHLAPDVAFRILVLPHRECGLSSIEFAAVVSDLAQRAGLPEVPFGVEGEAKRYWLERAERRLIERIAPAAVRSV